MKTFPFSKSQRLCSRKVIESVFETGNVINQSPLRLFWKESPPEEKVLLKIAISVPKKFFKKSVDRNKIKRQLREAWRLNNHKILPEIESSGKKFSVIIVYSSKQQLTYHETEAKIIVTLQRFAKEACKRQ